MMDKQRNGHLPLAKDAGLRAVPIRRSMPDYKRRVIFLDVERPDENAANNQQRVKRIRFYQNNGIYETNHFFTYDGVTYEILCTDQGFSEEAYNKNLGSYFRLFKKKRR